MRLITIGTVNWVLMKLLRRDKHTDHFSLFRGPIKKLPECQYLHDEVLHLKSVAVQRLEPQVSPG